MNDREILEDIKDALQDIASSLSWIKYIVIGACSWGLIFLIIDGIKWLLGR